MTQSGELPGDADALRRDAERYRWMRSQYTKALLVPSVRFGLDEADQFDARIDAAMALPPEHSP